MTAQSPTDGLLAAAVTFEGCEHRVALWNRVGTGPDDPLDYVVVASFVIGSAWPTATTLTRLVSTPDGIDPTAWALLNLPRNDLLDLAGKTDSNSAIETLGGAWREHPMGPPWASATVWIDATQHSAGTIVLPGHEAIVITDLPVACHIDTDRIGPAPWELTWVAL